MTVRQTHWRGALPRAVLLAVTASLVPIPAAASDAKPAQKPGTIQASMREVVAREVAVMPARRAAAARVQQTSASRESIAFFKTGPGIVALVALAAGVGYAIYSTQNDRITSPAKR